MKLISIALIIVGIGITSSGIIINQKNPDSKTENIGKSHYKGNNDISEISLEIFSEYVSGKFSSNYFQVTRTEKENSFAGSDLKVEYNISGEQGSFYLKLDWIRQYNNNMINVASLGEITGYQSHNQVSDEPIFKIIGIGGNQGAPKLLFIIPTEEIENENVNVFAIDNFKKEDLARNFFYDLKAQKLR
ncbi:MAG: hypothetical protein ACFCUM_09300 [Bacteroidales bacterium]